MKSFKICLFTSLLTLCAFAVVIFSCNKNDANCNGIFCNSGTCIDGSCQCPTGYGGKNCELVKCGNVLCDYGKVCINGGCACPEGFEGEQCAFRSRDKFLGVWVVLEDGTLSNAAQYSLSLTSDIVNTYTVRLQNFQNRFSSVKATVKEDSIIVPLQTINGNTIIGKGIFSVGTSGGHDKITMWYKVTDVSNDTDDFGYDTGSPSVWTR